MIAKTQLRYLQAIPLPNLLFYALDTLWRGKRALAAPSYLQVSVTSVCNLACQMCNNPNLKKKVHLSLDDFRQVIAAIPRTPIVVLTGLGENFMHPNFVEMVRICRDHRKFIQLTSNLNLRDQNRLAEVLNQNVDQLDVSIDGWDKASYEHIRRKGSWVLLLKNLQFAIAHIHAQKLSTKVRVRMVVSAYNQTGVLALLSTLRDLGVATVELSPMSGDIPQGDLSKLNSFADLIRLIRQQAPKGMVIETQNLKKYRNFSQCNYPYRGIYLAETGAYLPCCWQLHNSAYEETVATTQPFANSRQMSVYEAWNSKAMQSFRQVLNSGDEHPYCKGCELFDSRA